ncbi:ABC-type branched-chain amino acid transport system, ATPase component [Geosmithia morbida]|uniref:ABC-type branched-chain amino acid transport system, ATPase component n=1 Tax=Geosmithia morbida TaxID=1094350 RepID=A0A9P4YWR8_9HYPO|nr:ABC-type branched-chain amino acid transport system, ATPase component [Geosmithia morbida]KAF4123088.1 ABC-type branched-chain amino acid transport system, ATPase component [Geosmithia morbida]
MATTGGAPKSALWSQTKTLAGKNFTILLRRHFVSTIYTAILLPLILSLYLGILKNVGAPSDGYGTGKPTPVRSLSSAISAASSGRNTMVFVDSGLAGGAIDRVIDAVAKPFEAAGLNATRLSSQDDVGYVCSSSSQGDSNCFGAAIFHSSPDEGPGNEWNYTLRGDRTFGRSFQVDTGRNDAEIYTLPLQRAIDMAIAGTGSDSLDGTEQWPFTDQTESERQAGVTRSYQETFTQYNSITLLVIFYGIAYRLPGSMATEREGGLSQLIDAMMHTTNDWEARLARMLSFFYSFAATYFPGWVMASLIVHFLIWSNTSVVIVLIHYILAGLAMTSWAIMGGTLFKKAQLSGAVNAIAIVLLAVLAQAMPDPGTAAVALLSLLFAPCNIVFFFIYVAEYEEDGRSADLLHAPSSGDSALPGFVLWIFLGIHIVAYPILAAFLERAIHGVAAESRKVYRGDPSSQDAPTDAVYVDGLTKVYQPGLVSRLFPFVTKPRAPTVAVDSLTLSVKRGQIVSLLGANGSGKSTTLDAIAGISRFSQGSISIDASGGIGITPQKNVLWEDLTVLEHLRIFDELKSPHAKASAEQLNRLISSIGLAQKRNSRSQTLSGGQKRKLQLGMMLTGDSAMCCVDEVSSGIDPLSRRKIWDILLSERGRRTIVLTTHFLDEAELLSDDIAILSRGSLRVQGPPVTLKNTLGSGYRIHVLNTKTAQDTPAVDGVERTVTLANVTYRAPSSSLAANVIRALEAASIEYRLSGPTIEDVFLHVAEEVRDGERAPALTTTPSDRRGQILPEKLVEDEKPSDGVELMTGRQTGFLTQVRVLLRKRFTLLKTDWIPYAAALLIPIIAAAGTQVLVSDRQPVGCAPMDRGSAPDSSEYLGLLKDAVVAAGPSDIVQPYLAVIRNSVVGIDVELQDSFTALERYIGDNSKRIKPGAIWLGADGNTLPTFAYRADNSQSVYASIMMQNILDILRTNTSITTLYVPLDGTTPAGAADATMLMAFFCIAVAIAPAFFGFYPNVERRNGVRGLQYSSGVRSLPLWASHLLVDLAIFVVAFVVAAAVYSSSSDIWYNAGYLFPVYILYALTTILLAYVWSLFMGSQLATFAGIVVYNVVGFAVYLIAFLFITSFSPTEDVDRNILISHYAVSIFFPAGSLCRSLLVGLNIFSTACVGYRLRSYPGDMNAYGGPILYLSVQSILLFTVLLYHDSGNKLPSSYAGNREPDKKAPSPPRAVIDEDAEIAKEELRVHSSDGGDGMQAKNLIKVFGSNTAVDNVTFGVKHGEVFALLGPNGAGKSTIMSLIQGDIPLSRNGGDVFIEKVSVTDHRALARTNLGVCPQNDAVDNMTVLEHLRHYTRLRGIDDVEGQVGAVMRAVGLEAFADTMAPHLSGGNKRKLSLAMALTGNPSVILLDEPSSGLDAAAKRIMWRTLERIKPGRSILLTTHSMEEADALASRAGILAQRMLAIGNVDSLRSRFGDSVHVHLVSRTAPYSTAEEMERTRAWVVYLFPGAVVEPETYHGQMRFRVPAGSVLESAATRAEAHAEENSSSSSSSAIGQVIVTLEENAHLLGIEHHSVSATTLSDVFLSIVSRHNVLEEGYPADGGGSGDASRWVKLRKVLLMV